MAILGMPFANGCHVASPALLVQLSSRFRLCVPGRIDELLALILLFRLFLMLRLSASLPVLCWSTLLNCSCVGYFQYCVLWCFCFHQGNEWHRVISISWTPRPAGERMNLTCEDKVAGSVSASNIKTAIWNGTELDSRVCPQEWWPQACAALSMRTIRAESFIKPQLAATNVSQQLHL